MNVGLLLAKTEFIFCSLTKPIAIFKTRNPMYAVYTTEALICGSRDSYTSDRSYLLFTKAAGMVWATARSVREERSKQRHALQDFALVRVSLVRGKRGWRIGSVEGQGNAFFSTHTRSQRTGVTQVVKLLRRFLHGEEPQPQVYQDVAALLTYLATSADDQVPLLVDQFTLRTLHALGYIAPHEAYEHLIADTNWLSTPQPLPPQAAQAITRGFEVSHL